MEFKEKSKIYKDTIVKQKTIERFGGIVLGLAIAGKLWWLLLINAALLIWLRKKEKVTEEFELDYL